MSKTDSPPSIPRPFLGLTEEVDCFAICDKCIKENIEYCAIENPVHPSTTKIDIGVARFDDGAMHNFSVHTCETHLERVRKYVQEYLVSETVVRTVDLLVDPIYKYIMSRWEQLVGETGLFINRSYGVSKHTLKHVGGHTSADPLPNFFKKTPGDTKWYTQAISPDGGGRPFCVQDWYLDESVKSYLRTGGKLDELTEVTNILVVCLNKTLENYISKAEPYRPTTKKCTRCSRVRRGLI